MSMFTKNSLPQHETVSVEAVVDNTQRRISWVDSDQVHIKKSIGTEGSTQVEIEGRAMGKREFSSMAQVAGLQTGVGLNVLSHSRVKQVGALDEGGLYRLFSEVVGTSDYARHREESQGLVQNTAMDEKRSMELLEEFRERLGELEVDREDFEKFEEAMKGGNR